MPASLSLLLGTDGQVKKALSATDGAQITANPPTTVTGALVRPANTTPYTIGDVWGTASNSIITLENVVPSTGAGGWIFSVSAVKSSGSSTNATMNFHIFNASPSAAIADHSAFSQNFAEVNSYVGCLTNISFSTENATDACARYTDSTIRLAFKCADNSRNLYVCPVLTQAYTPGNAENLFVKFGILT